MFKQFHDCSFPCLPKYCNVQFLAMNWYSQLTRLILDFYRENPEEHSQLSILYSCKLSRWWGVLRIHCRDMYTARLVMAAGSLICEPIIQLRLAHQIKVIVKGNTLVTLPVPQQMDYPSPGDRLGKESQSWWFTSPPLVFNWVLDGWRWVYLYRQNYSSAVWLHEPIACGNICNMGSEF